MDDSYKTLNFRVQGASCIMTAAVADKWRDTNAEVYTEIPHAAESLQGIPS